MAGKKCRDCGAENESYRYTCKSCGRSNLKREEDDYGSSSTSWGSNTGFDTLGGLSGLGGIGGGDFGGGGGGFGGGDFGGGGASGGW